MRDARLLSLLFLATLLPSTVAVHPQAIHALAPVEVVATGLGAVAGVAVDDEGNVLVALPDAGQVVRIAPDGRRSVVAHGLERPVGLALDLDGRLLVADERAGRVALVEAPRRLRSLISGLRRPRWLAVDGTGTVYVTAERATRDTRPPLEGPAPRPHVVLALGREGVLSVFADGFGALEGIAAGDGALHVLDRGVTRIAILPGGRAGLRAPVVLPGVLARPVGLARDALGALYAGAEGLRSARGREGDVVAKLHDDGAPTSFAWALDDPRGLALDASGDLYVAEGRAGRVLRFHAPRAPTLDEALAFTSRSEARLSGTAEAGARIDAIAAEGTSPVSAVADQAGRFAVAVTLAPERSTAFAVFATAQGGEGLTSPSAAATIVHDATPPSLVFVAPPAGGFVRETATVRVEAADGGSQVAAVVVAADGRPLPASSLPAPPAPSVAATAAWSTASSADGVHTLQATAVDRAGNTATGTRNVIVDNTPPDTTITAGPSGAVVTDGVSFEFSGDDALTPAAMLAFAWRLDGGAWSPFGMDRRATLPGLGGGPHRFEVKARDLAGNEDPAPASRDFSIDALRVTIVEPGEGAAVAAGVLLVRGGIDTGGAEAGVSVNGVRGFVSGTEWAAQVAVEPGTTTLVATVTTAAGARASAARTVTVTEAAPAVLLRALPESGVAPLRVAWQVVNQTGHPLVRLELDATGSGVFGPPATDAAALALTYAAPGVMLPALRATDDLGRTHVARTVVHVESPQSVVARFRGLWADFRARLQTGDHAGALARLTPALQPRLRAVLERLGPDLPGVAAGIADLAVVDQLGDLAETVVAQPEGTVTMLHFVYFRRDSRGQWLIEEM
jgi:sugar lactone lactonase YvrE